MATQTQLTAFVLPVGDESIPKGSPVWRDMIETLRRNARFQGATRYEAPPLPSALQDDSAWVMEVDGVSFRCIQMYVMVPPDGEEPGYRVRVDVICFG